MMIETSEFEQLMIDHRAMVYSIALQVLRSEVAAEEVTQDVFVKVYFAWDRFDGLSKVSTWIYRIAYNEAVSAKRKIKDNQVCIENVCEFFLRAPDEGYDYGKDKQIAKLNELINALKPDDSLIITLYYYNNYSVDEVASIVGQSVSNVKVRLFRLRKQLQEMFNEQERENNEN